MLCCGPAPHVGVLLALSLSVVFYEIYAGGDPWNYWRIMAPTVPLLIALVVSAAATVSRRIVETRAVKARLRHDAGIRSENALGALIALMTLLCILAAEWRFLPEFALYKSAYQILDNKRNVNMALAISDTHHR